MRAPSLRNANRVARIETLRRHHPVRIDDELLGRAFIEILVTFRRIVERNNRHIHSLRGMELVVKNGVHQLAVVFHDGALSRSEDVRLGPSEADTDAEVSGLGGIIYAARIV